LDSFDKDNDLKIFPIATEKPPVALSSDSAESSPENSLIGEHVLLDTLVSDASSDSPTGTIINVGLSRSSRAVLQLQAPGQPQSLMVCKSQERLVSMVMTMAVLVASWINDSSREVGDGSEQNGLSGLKS
jgi:hypothetical protein